MNVELQGQVIASQVNVDAVLAMVNYSRLQIAGAICQASMAAVLKRLDCKGLAEKHITKTLEEEISALDAQTQRVFQKLLLDTFEFVQNFGPIINHNILGGIEATHGEESPALFLGSFVLPAAKTLVEKLKVDHPAALEIQEIWQ